MQIMYDRFNTNNKRWNFYILDYYEILKKGSDRQSINFGLIIHLQLMAQS